MSQVLMINFPQLGTNAAGAVLKVVFREVSGTHLMYTAVASAGLPH